MDVGRCRLEPTVPAGISGREGFNTDQMPFEEETGKVVLFGGYGAKQIQTPFEPGGRWATSMNCDPVFAGLVLLGGEVTGDPFTNETWLLLSRH